MRYQFYSQQQSKLIVYFAGWGTPLQAVAHLTLPADYDLLLCYDYRSLELEFDFSSYQEVHLVAWSLGVWAAERAMQCVPLASATAINGTGLPKDDEFGIPQAIFTGTLEGLSPESRLKFERRMCRKADLAQYQAFEPRPFDEIQKELGVLNALVSANRIHGLIEWQRALISSGDKIMPPAHQHAYWQQQQVRTQELEGEHYPFLQFSSWLELIQAERASAEHQ